MQQRAWLPFIYWLSNNRFVDAYIVAYVLANIATRLYFFERNTHDAVISYLLYLYLLA